MYVRFMSALAVVVVIAVFLLPSTLAIYAAVNGTAWDSQDAHSFVSPFLLPALAWFLSAFFFIRRTVAVKADVTHPLAQVPLFELDCALLR